jgi:hypothetical protein
LLFLLISNHRTGHRCVPDAGDTKGLAAPNLSPPRHPSLLGDIRRRRDTLADLDPQNFPTAGLPGRFFCAARLSLSA